VRENLKHISDWKTFPQVFVKSEFVGGVDVVTEQIHDGDFLQKVPKECLGSGLYPRLKKLVNQQKFVIALDGTPSVPRDSVGEQAVSMLRKSGIDEFAFIDISTDEQLRGGLKNFDRFTTFPQLYVDGENYGGIEKIEETFNAGKLGELKNPKAPAVAKSSLNKHTTHVCLNRLLAKIIVSAHAYALHNLESGEGR